MVWVDGMEKAGDEAYSGRGLNDTGHFWSVPVPGHVAVIQYQAPPNQTALPAIEVDQVAHIYADPLANLKFQRASITNTADLLPCEQDVSCHPVDPVARDAVGLMIFNDGVATYLCTGTMLNDQDPNTYAGYFLTANHCLSSQDMVDSLVVYWFYQTDSCGGIPPDLYSLPQSVGGRLLATALNTDFTLLRLAEDPREGQGFAAWTTADPANGAVSGIHHPQGYHKHVSYGTLTTAYPICSSYPLTHYWYLDWYLGITESVSSGSPLFNDNWQVIGQLFGTCSKYGKVPGCDNPQDFNTIYGKFGISFPAIAPYLTGIIPDDSYEDNDRLDQSAPLAMGVHQLRLVDFDDYFVVTSPTTGLFRVAASFTTANMDLDLYLMRLDGSTLAASESPTNSLEKVAIQAIAGSSYIIRAEKKHKWGDDYTLLVDPAGFKGDFDRDGDIDLDDFARMQVCISGAQVPASNARCLMSDLDDDGDVDRADIDAMLNCMSGDGIPVKPECVGP